MELAHQPVFRLGGVTVRPSTREIVFAGGREVLEPRVMAVLVALAQAKGEVVTRDQLTEACWDGRIVSDDAINRVISRIRRVTELTGGKDFTLETITKVGYRLVVAGTVEEAEPAPATPVAAAAGGRRLGLVVAGLVAVVLLAVGGWWTWGRSPSMAPDKPLTLAVLPFDNMGAAGPDDSLALGMAREVRNTLSRVRGLRVVSDSSSFAVAGERISATDMARRLGADLLLDGSLTRDGDTIRLTAELVDGWSGVNLWTGSKAGPAADLDLLRQLMAAAVFEQMVGRIGPNRVEVLAPPPRGDPRVYRLVLEALEILQNVQSLQNRPERPARLLAGDRAKALLDEALAIEPASPIALSLMARLTSGAVTTELDALNLSVLERQERAADYLRRALASNPDTVVALAALGEYYRRYEWRWADAQALMERALALDPNNADTHLSYSFYLTMVGRCVDAVEHARLAVALDPEFGFRTLGVPRALKCAGQYQEAADLYGQALRPDPGNLFVIREVYLYHLERRDAAALRALVATIRDNVWKGAPPVEVVAMLDRITLAADALEGRPDAYVARIERDVRAYDDPNAEPPPDAVSHSADTLWVHALEFAHAGKAARAVDMLERATAGGSLYIPENLPYGENEFTPDVRADPRYERIWRRDPRLADLARLRLAAAHARQMVGRLEDGSVVTPKAVDSGR